MLGQMAAGQWKPGRGQSSRAREERNNRLEKTIRGEKRCGDGENWGKKHKEKEIMSSFFLKKNILCV